MMISTRLRAAAVVATILVGAAVACTSAVGLEDRPCPCTQGYVCCASSAICIAEGQYCSPHDDGGSDSAPASGCVDDKQCIADGGIGNICVNGACIEGCRTNGECLDQHPGKPWTCRKDTNKCVPLLFAENESGFEGPGCPFVLTSGGYNKLEDLRDDDTYFVGMVCSEGGAAPTLGPSCVEGAELARLEWMKESGNGLPMGSKKRPIAWVNCDDNVLPDSVLIHLIDDLGIKAILGPSNGDVMGKQAQSILDQSPSVIATKRAIAISGADLGSRVDSLLALLDKLITDPDPRGLLWQTYPADLPMYEAWAKYLSDYLEPAVKAKYPGVTGPIKVAIVNTNDAFGVSISDVSASILRFNGKSAYDNSDTAFIQIPYGSPATDPDFAVKLAAAANKLLAFEPHVIFVGGGNESLAGITKPIEDGWTNATYKPFYVYSSLVFGAGPAQFLNGLTTDLALKENLRKRMIGVTPTSPNQAQLARYGLRHHAQWDGFQHTLLPPNPLLPNPPSRPVSPGPTILSAATYDAAYVLFSALVATGKEDPTGDEIRSAIKFTQPGTGAPILDVGPDNVLAISQALQAKKRIDLNGVLSTLDFVGPGVNTNAAMWCLPPIDPATGNVSPPTAIETKFVYDPSDKTFKLAPGGKGPPTADGFFPDCMP